MASIYEWFLKTLLVTKESIPIQSLWGVDIENIPEIVTDIEQFESNWDIASEFGKLKSSKWVHKDAKALIFAQGVRIPGEGMNITRTGPENTGLLRGIIGEGRKDVENLSISFLETNTSFTDYVLRPWAVMVSYKSLKDQRLKTTITVTQYKKTGHGGSAFYDTPRKIVTFYGACPVSINTEEYDYGPDKLSIRQVEFAYERYSIQ